ncbi:MAG: hypothetical protein ACRDTJ_04880, partial [Pseudonocardiaceae bacterium]
MSTTLQVRLGGNGVAHGEDASAMSTARGCPSYRRRLSSREGVALAVVGEGAGGTADPAAGVDVVDVSDADGTGAAVISSSLLG